MSNENKISRLFREIVTVLITSIAVISILYLPIQIDDYWVDLRMIPLIFLAYMQGWRVAIPTLILASLWRFLMGGAGMVPGILFGMVGPTLFVLMIRKRFNYKWRYFIKISFVLICWLISDLPIIWLIPNGAEVFQNIALIRATTFVATSIILYTFIRLEQQRALLNQRLRKLANEDYLTQLLNRRKFLEVVELEVKNASENSKHYISMIDIDNFKQLNDIYGHLVGDKILRELGEVLKRFENENVKIGRYGGEEFIVYIGNKTDVEVIKLIKTIHERIQNMTFIIHSDQLLHITLSIGVAKFIENASLNSTINLADQALYNAKNNGRNCIVTSF